MTTASATSRSFYYKYANSLRRRRFCFFESLLEGMRKPIRVLDCGGTVEFWQANVNILSRESKFDLTLINLFQPKEVPSLVRWHVGDVRDLSRFGDDEFDVVFSNAVINLMPTWEDQGRMSREVMRVGKRFFVQSPNRYFPLDWRTLVPFFHLLSPEFQSWCLTHFRVGIYPRVTDSEKARTLATRVRDLSSGQMRCLFPGCKIFRERWFGFTKSLVAYGGW